MDSENSDRQLVFDDFPYAYFPRTFQCFFLRGKVSGLTFFAPVFEFPDRFILDRLEITNCHIFNESTFLRFGFTTHPMPHPECLEDCLPFFYNFFNSDGLALPVNLKELAQFMSPPLYQFFDVPCLKPVFLVDNDTDKEFLLRFDFYYLDLNPDLHHFVSNDSTKKVAPDDSKHD